ncbi:hypothetical protein [Brachybacterium sp. FME24]|uniref:hypothetical protein n=1 Tax=Brachybacterium sp. FME24 TaxID=2742605 RepID=UPI001867140B|nr:hypothetical protein [Brachybacterium sp. FME24]
MREVGEPDVFPGSSLEKSTMELAETPEQSWTVEVKRTVKVSRTNVGCIPVPVRGCETLMREAAMPQIEGFS